MHRPTEELLREHYELCAGSCPSDRLEDDDGCTCLVCRTGRALSRAPAVVEEERERLAKMADAEAEDADDKAAENIRESRYQHARRDRCEAIAQAHKRRAADWRTIAALLRAPSQEAQGESSQPSEAQAAVIERAAGSPVRPPVAREPEK